MPQIAQTDYLRLPIADSTQLTSDEKDILKRWVRDGVILDAVVTNSAATKQVRVAGYDNSGDYPQLIMGDNTTLDVISIVSATIDETTASVGELLKQTSVSENDLIKVTFSNKLPVGSYTGSIKTESETINIVTFTIADAASATMQATATSTIATKLSNKAVLSISVTIGGEVKGTFATPS